MRFPFKALAVLSAALLQPALTARDDTDDENRFVRLMSAKSVRALEIEGRTFRKAEGPARFLHNDTWLICDTALWDMEAQIIYAIGNVSIEQENTELTSDRLTYDIQTDLAEFRGSVVQLQDKEGNMLRTSNLDYNTKDSIAIFRQGGSMKDKDGQIIESLDGRYEAKVKLYTFTGAVNMFTDSVFVQTSLLEYDAKRSLATFPNAVNAWKEDKMLSGDRGFYDRAAEQFFFRDNVHVQTRNREGWSDSLFFNRGTSNVEMFGNAQINDEERNVTGMADELLYVDSLSLVTMTRKPVVLLPGNESDTCFIRADTMRYRTVMRFEIDSSMVASAQERLKGISTDAVANIKAKAEQAARQAAEEAARREEEENPGMRPPQMSKSKDNEEPKNDARDAKTKDTARKKPEKGKRPGTSAVRDSVTAADSLVTTRDSVMTAADSLTATRDSVMTVVDSLTATQDSVTTADTLPPPLDSTKVSFLSARGDVRMYSRKLQLSCDSLEYSGLDSLARLFITPVVWNKNYHQYDADSIYLVVKGDKVEKAHLLSNAFIHVKESEKFYDQIRAAEVVAFFNDSTQLTRFDALGSAVGLFYIKEKEKIGTANKKESSILSATLVDEEITQVSYFENPKSTAYPIAQMNANDHRLKGFDWQEDKKPTSGLSITSRTARASQRTAYSAMPRAEFKETEKYFAGYMAGIYSEIARTDSLRKANEALRKQKADTLVRAADSLAIADSTSAGDSLSASDSTGKGAAIDSLAHSDSSALKAAADSAEAVLAALSPKERKAAEREKRRLAREKAREERWAALDARDALKQAKKDASKKAREEAKKARKLERYRKLKAKEDALREKYLNKYLKKLNRQKYEKTDKTVSGDGGGHLPDGLREGPGPLRPDTD